jgi:Cellulose biosynthesis protein BcsS
MLSARQDFTSAFQEYWALTRLCYRRGERLSLGLGGGVVDNEEYDAKRCGGFARVNFHAMEVSLSSGFTGNYLEDDPSFSRLTLPVVLRTRVGLNQSALPAPLRQCLASSATHLDG